MSAVDKCSLPNRDNLMQPIHMQVSQKIKVFHNFLLHFQNLVSILNIFKKKMTLIAYLFVRLPPAKNVVRYISKKSRFRLTFEKEHGNRVSTLFKFERQSLYHIYCSTRRQFSCKKSLLVIC